MLIRFDRDDVNRTIIATMRGVLTAEDFRVVIDRHAAEDAWRYAMAYDLRTARFGADAPSTAVSLAQRLDALGQRTNVVTRHRARSLAISQ